MKEQILQKIANHKGLTFENIIGDSFELFKKVFVYGVLKVVVGGILMYAIQFALMAPAFALIGLNYQNFTNSEELGVLAVISMVFIYFIILFLSTFIHFTLSVGFYRICFQQEAGMNVTIETFFDALRKKYWLKTFVLSVLASLLLVVAFLFFVIPGIYMLIPLGFVTVIYAFNIDLSIQDIFSIAFKIGNKYWLVLFLSCVAAFFMSMLGIFACFIGIIVTQTFIYMPFYTAYSKVIGFDMGIANEIDSIGENKDN